ncbi:hypothetical protein [Flavobacterium sp. MMS24-S5]|uniref:hypothetical protein n=1 Tax=Flavobacterium sp. MMS24-S5 TaxID=3416605 RepID=UPI003D076E93
MAAFAGMGVGGLFLRKACVDENRYDEYFSVALKCVFINIIIAIIVSQFIFFNTGLDIIQALCLASFYLPIAFQYFVISYAQVSENFAKVSIAQIINPLLRVATILFLFLLSPTLTNTTILLFFANLGSFVVLLKLIDQNKIFQLLFFKQSKSVFFSFFKESFLYSFNGTINVVQIQLSIIMAMYLFGFNTSGIYSSAIVLLTACYILPNIIFGTYLLPQYHKLEKTVLKITSLQHSIVAFVLGILFFIVVYASSEIVIKLLYPATFKNSAHLLNILAISLPFRFYSTGIGAALLNEKCIKRKVSASFLGLIFQVFLMLSLRNIGEESLSISFVLSEVLTAVIYTIIFLKYFNNKAIS